MSVSEPGKIITPWAESGLKNPIPPAANPATGRAGFDQGFSAINMTAKEAGGIPPFGQDFNGIFYEVTNILRYIQAGGQPTFDAALATAIGGYPKGAMVLGGDGLTLWQSQIESNSADPDIDPSSWGTFDIGLKAQLAAPGGAGLVGGVAKPVTWMGFAGGADPTGAASSSAAFTAANVAGGTIYVPDGLYKLDANITSSSSTYWMFGDAVSFIGGNLYQVPWWQSLGAGVFNYMTVSSKHAHRAIGDGLAVVGVAHSSEGGNTGGASVGVAGMAYNDNETGGRGGAWSLYGTAVRAPGAAGATHGIEVDIANLGPVVDMYPNRMFPAGQTHGAWIASGGELAGAGVAVNPASVAIGIVSNDPAGTACFDKGIVFHNKAISGTDGVTGSGVAIALAKGHKLDWYNNSNQVVAEISCTNATSAVSQRLEFTDFGTEVVDRLSSAILFKVNNISGAVSRLEVSAGTAGSGVSLNANGSETDIAINLKTKGDGRIYAFGDIVPNTANTKYLGIASVPMAGGFTQAAFTVTSDERAKTRPESLTGAMLDAAAEVEWVLFQYLDRVEEKGDDGARWHFGAVAQRFVEAFQRHGLDPFRFAFICYDEWEDRYAKVQTNEGALVTKTRTVSRPVMVKSTRKILVDEAQDDGTKIKKYSQEEFETPKLKQVYIFNEDGSPRLDGNGVRAFVMEPVMEDVIEEYTESAPPEYVDVLEVPAGSRYGIRYDQAIILKQKQIERDNERKLEALASRIKELESK